MATGTTTPKPTGTQNAPLTLQQKFVKLREAIPAITQKKHSDGVKYKFAKIFDVYELLTPAMNEYGVNFDIVKETATRHAENGDDLFYHSYVQETYKGSRLVWVYEADLTILWTNADNPEDTLEVTLHAIGTNDGGPDKAKGSAWTYCLKYYLFEKFGIDQGDDDPDMKDLTGDTTPPNGAGGKKTQTQAKNGQKGQTGAVRQLSDAQLTRMYNKGVDANCTHEQVDKGIYKMYGVTDPRNLTREQYDHVCEQLDAQAKMLQQSSQVIEGGEENA